MEIALNQVSASPLTSLRLIPRAASNKSIIEIVTGLQNVVEFNSLPYCEFCDCITEYTYSVIGKACKRCGKVDVLRTMINGFVGDANGVLLNMIVFHCPVRPVIVNDHFANSIEDEGLLVKLFGSYYFLDEIWNWLFQNEYLQDQKISEVAM